MILSRKRTKTGLKRAAEIKPSLTNDPGNFIKRLFVINITNVKYHSQTHNHSSSTKSQWFENLILVNIDFGDFIPCFFLYLMISLKSYIKHSKV